MTFFFGKKQTIEMITDACHDVLYNVFIFERRKNVQESSIC